jgi:predicted nucleic acid-binding protein
MPEVLIDTNVILRLFDTTSEPEQTAKAKRLFESARSGKIELIVAPPALFEVAWVLRSTLKWPNNEILDILEAITSWPGIRVLDKARVKTALTLGRRNNCGFADSYLAATAKECEWEFATFDERHFRKLETKLYEMK